MSGKDSNFNVMLASDAVYKLAIDIALLNDSLNVKAEAETLARFAFLIAVVAATETKSHTELDGMKREVYAIVKQYADSDATIEAIHMIDTETDFGNVADWAA